MRDRNEILRDIAYEQKEGVHTFTMCKCGKMGCRGFKCTLCLTKELNSEVEQEAKSK